MNDLLADDIVSRVVGVIDLRHGLAVHAIAGNRKNYRPVALCGGDPVALADHYRDLGVTALYVADLDAIVDGEMQAATIDAIGCSAPDAMLVDVGWAGQAARQFRDAMANLSNRHASIGWIAATESCRSTEAVADLAELVSPERTLVGLDYRGGELITEMADEAAWVRAAAELGCHGLVILDLASVGTARGPTTMEICRRVKESSPTVPIYSGGGIRTAEDVRLLIQAGCDRCLVATSLQRC